MSHLIMFFNHSCKTNTLLKKKKKEEANSEEKEEKGLFFKYFFYWMMSWATRCVTHYAKFQNLQLCITAIRMPSTPPHPPRKEKRKEKIEIVIRIKSFEMNN